MVDGEKYVVDRLSDYKLPTGKATLEKRAELMLACQLSASVRQRVKTKCKDDPVWFIDYWCWTFDPRPEAAPNHDKPFLLYDFQRDYITWLHMHINSSKDGLCEKSRDMGASWCTYAYLAHGYLFQEAFTAKVGSRVENYVDDKTVDSIFGKILYTLRHLPGWMLPEGYDEDKHKTYMYIENPENGNYISGESSNPNFSRAGRYRVVVFDEGAFWPDLRAAWTSASHSTRCRIVLSTPFGMNFFGELRHQQIHPVDVITLLWNLHPDKDEAWYKREKDRSPADEFAREVDISYKATLEGLVYPRWSQVPQGNYPYEQDWPVYCSWDFGISDDTAIIWWQVDPEDGKPRMIDCYSNRGKPIDFYVPFITGNIGREQEDYDYTPMDLRKIASHSFWGTPTHFGDPAGRQRSSTEAVSVVDVLERYGIYVFTNTKAVDYRTRMAMTELGIKDLKVNMPECGPVDHAMSNARFPQRRAGSQATTSSNAPVHDSTSHFRSAVEYFFVNYQNRSREDTRREDYPVEKRRMVYDR